MASIAGHYARTGIWRFSRGGVNDDPHEASSRPSPRPQPSPRLAASTGSVFVGTEITSFGFNYRFMNSAYSNRTSATLDLLVEGMTRLSDVVQSLSIAQKAPIKDLLPKDKVVVVTERLTVSVDWIVRW
jgi:hypothetical protein